MLLDLEKAHLMYKLAVAKKNWGAKYDRLEHFKRFPNLDKIIKEFSKMGWIIIHKKSNYTAISLNTEYKREIIEFIETQIPGFKGNIR
jgi:hypothetical protein